MIHGAGPDHPWDAAVEGWLRAAPGPHVGWSGDVSSLIRALPPPSLVLHAANVLQGTEIHTWGCDVATIRWLPTEGGATRLTVAHFKDGGPTHDDALSRLGDVPGPLLLMLPKDFAAALLRELDSCDGLRVGWGAVADGTLLALLHRDVADGCQCGAFVPHLTGRHTYRTTPPRGHPRPAWDDLFLLCGSQLSRWGLPGWDDLIAAFHDHGILLTTRGRRSGRKRSARTIDAVSPPAC